MENNKPEVVRVNYARHNSVFDPTKYGNQRIDVIGAGATGSYVVLQLAKLGCKQIHVWDFDKVEAHNIPNQLFGLKDVGKMKVDALKALVQELASIDITVHPEKFTGKEKFGEVLFVLTDTMSSRKEIWKNTNGKVGLGLYIETRMGEAEGRIYTMEPQDDPEKYEKTLYDDAQTPVSACGTQTTVGSTAMVLAGLAVTAMIEWRLKSEQRGHKPPNESIFGIMGDKCFHETHFAKPEAIGA